MTASTTEVRVDRRLTSAGDATLWLAPLVAGSDGVANVLHFTDADGTAYAVRLTDADLVRISRAATNILTAPPGAVHGWLDDAARTVAQIAVSDQGKHPTKRRTADPAAAEPVTHRRTRRAANNRR